MSFWKKDHGEKRSFGCYDEFSIGPDGRVLRTGTTELSAEICSILAESYRAIANELETGAHKLRRDADDLIEGEILHSMVSGR